MTKILPCTCKDEFQDATYGKGMRVHNIGGKGKEKLAYCTVCSPSRRRIRELEFITDPPPPVFGCVKGVFPLTREGRIQKLPSGAKSVKL